MTATAARAHTDWGYDWGDMVRVRAELSGCLKRFVELCGRALAWVVRAPAALLVSAHGWHPWRPATTKSWSAAGVSSPFLVCMRAHALTATLPGTL